MGRALVVGQVALSLVLLIGAGLFVRSLIKLESIDVGFDPDSVLLFQLAPTQPAPLAERREVYRQLVARAESVLQRWPVAGVALLALMVVLGATLLAGLGQAQP